MPNLPSPSVLDVLLDSALRSTLAVYAGSDLYPAQDVRTLVTVGAYFGGSAQSDAAETLASQATFVPRPPWLTDRFQTLVTSAATGDVAAWRAADRILARYQSDETRSTVVRESASALRDRLAVYVYAVDESARQYLRSRLLEPRYDRSFLDAIITASLPGVLFGRLSRGPAFGECDLKGRDVEGTLRLRIAHNLLDGARVILAHSDDAHTLAADALRRFRKRRFADEALVEKPVDVDVQADIAQVVEDFGTEDGVDRRKRAADVEQETVATAAVVEPPPPAQTIPEAAAPTLVVVPDLSHLPHGKPGDTKPRDLQTPGWEFKDLSQQALPLAVCLEWQADARADLHARFPWCTDAIDTLLLDLVGRPYARLRPTLLVGGAGTGKTSLARAVGRLLVSPPDGERVFAIDARDPEPTVYSAAGVHDAAFSGTSRQWGTGRASVPLQAVKRAGIGNPVVILDEIEKASHSRRNGSLLDAILAFLEPATARVYHDPYVECAVDLSAVTYLATANSLEGLSAPLASRFRIIRIPAPGVEHLPAIAQSALVACRDEAQASSEWVPDLTPEETEAVVRAWRETPEYRRTLRLVRRAVEVVVATRERLRTVH